MPNKCAAPGCKTGYRGHKMQAGVSTHQFPRDPAVRSEWLKWLKAVRGKKYSPTTNSMLCSLHFRPCDLQCQSNDSNARRLKNGTWLNKRYLKNDAVPTTFPNFPEYPSNTEEPEPATVPASSASPRQVEQSHLEKEIESVFNPETFESLDELLGKLQSEATLPSTCAAFMNAEGKLFCGRLVPSVQGPPNLAFGIEISDTFEFQLFCEDRDVPASAIEDIASLNGIRNVTEVADILEFLNDFKEMRFSGKDSIKSAVLHLDNIVNGSDLDPEALKVAQFSLEQLKLALEPKFARRYSPNFLSLAVRWHSTSPSLYEQMLKDGVLCLPSKKHVSRLLFKPLIPDAGFSEHACKKEF